jgi:AP endonuclease-1
MLDPLMSGIPLILETPAAENPLEVGELAIWVKEIALLYKIQAIPDEEWTEKEEGIREEWRKVRDVMNPPKEKKPAAKKGKGKAKKGESDDDEGDE